MPDGKCPGQSRRLPAQPRGRRARRQPGRGRRGHHRGRRRGAQIVIVPELTPSGYVFERPAEGQVTRRARRRPDRRQWTSLATEHDLVIIGGFAELGDDGRPLQQRRCSPTHGGVRRSTARCTSGTPRATSSSPATQPPPVVDTKYGRIAMMICYDVEFPEWVRLPALAGADLLAVPTNWPAEPVPPGERPMVAVNVQAAAFANRMFVAAACRVGDRARRELGRRQPHRRTGRLPAGRPRAGRPMPQRPRDPVAGCDLRRRPASAQGRPAAAQRRRTPTAAPEPGRARARAPERLAAAGQGQAVADRQQHQVDPRVGGRVVVEGPMPVTCRAGHRRVDHLGRADSVLSTRITPPGLIAARSRPSTRRSRSCRRR